MYNNVIMNIFTSPKNVGLIKNASGVGSVENKSTGEVFKLYIKVENGVIIDAKFKTFGSVLAIVSSSVVASLLIGKNLEEVLSLTINDIFNVIGEVEGERVNSCFDALELIKEVVVDYNKKEEKRLKMLQKQSEQN